MTMRILANPIPWPNGHKCAVSLSWDVDVESGLVYRHREATHKRMAARTLVRYDANVAVPRLMEVFKALNIQQTFFVPGWVIDRYPATVDLILEHGHEVGLHGYMHERSNELSPEQEAEVLERALQTYVKRVGTRPKGWRAPAFAFSDKSIDLLINAGFDYDSSLMGSDLPYLLKGATGNLVELPTEWTSDDWPQYMHNQDFNFSMPVRASNRAMEVFRAEFDAARTFGAMWIAVWHPFLSGRLSRIQAVIELIEDIQQRGDVWLTRLDHISSHVRSLMAAGTWQPMIEQLPFHQLNDLD
jgi:peptidoglycan-N-acetylglucosamine deacetylase